jgi:adenylate cyclase
MEGVTTAEATGPGPGTGLAGAGITVQLLGPFTVTSGGQAAGPWPRPTARRLCELVFVSPGRRISRDLAREELFQGTEPRAAARALSKALSMARATLAELGEPGVALLGADLTHIWAAPEARVDAADQLAAIGGALAMEPGPGRTQALAAALAADGELLADEPYAEWAARPREHLESLRQRARLALARDLSAAVPAGTVLGSPVPAGPVPAGPALDAWLAVFEHDPASEEAAGALMHGYHAQGHRELAVRIYERCAAALAELALSTSPSLDELHAAVTAPSGPPGAVLANPVLANPVLANPLPEGAVPEGAGPGGRAVPGPVAAPREELRTVTMLFAEVAAPAGMGARMDPEAVRDVIGTSLAAVIAEVEALGGLVTSVSGRGLQAMWGAPQSHEDDPERALRAAYRALAAVGAQPPAGDGTVRAAATPGSDSGNSNRWLAAYPVTLRIGVETGPAVVGSIGGGAKVEYGALGEVVAVAAALQSHARPGTALVGPVTRAAAGHLFSWGADEQAASYLDAPLAAGGQLRVGARGPIVGRRTELAALDTALREAIAGRGGVVLLRGDPGLGKTRLIQECRKRFMAWVGARDGRLPLWLEGRSASYASATPYGLYQQLLAGWTGVAPDKPRPVARAALERALRALLASTELLPVLEHVMGLVPATRRADHHQEMGPEELRRVAFAALRTVISRLVPARRPAVIVLEDLHWADPTSLRFTAELVTLTAGRPLLILATTRPGAGPEVGDLATIAGVRTVELRPLPDAAARELARALIGGAEPSAEVLDAVVATVDGNPLFLEERLSSLLETGALTGGPGGWQLTDAPGPALPQVLDRLVRSRIDRLSPAAQEVVRIASVLGPQFLVAILTDVYSQEHLRANDRMLRADLTPAIAELRDSGIVHHVIGSPVPGGVVPGGLGGSYQFRHALLQEAAYYGMLRADRRRLHGRAAAALEAARPNGLDEIAAVLGRHFAAAGHHAKAVHYLELAGDNATWAFANDEAISAYQEGLSVTEEIADADAGARLSAKLANVLWRTARKAETRAAFTEALRLAGTLAAGEPPPAERLRRAWLLTRLGRLEMTDGRYDAASQAFDAAAALLGDTPGDSDAEADVWLELMIDGRSDLLLRQDDAAGARAALAAARPVLEARGNASRRYGYYQSLGVERVHSLGLHADEQAIADFRRALAAAEESHDAKDIGYATYFTGWALWQHGDLDAAREYLTSALAIAERVGEVVLRANALGSMALAALARRDVAAVRVLTPQAVTAAEEVDTCLRSWASAPLAWLAWQDGRPEDVVAVAAQAAERGPSDVPYGDSYKWVYLLPLIAVRLERGDTEAAVAHAREVLAPGQQVLPDELAARVRQACRAWDTGSPGPAADGLRAALDIAATVGYF